MSFSSIAEAIFDHALKGAVIDDGVIVSPDVVRDMDDDWDWWGIEVRQDEGVLILGYYVYELGENHYEYHISSDGVRRWYSNCEVCYGDSDEDKDVIREVTYNDPLSLVEEALRLMQSGEFDNAAVDMEALVADPRWKLD